MQVQENSTEETTVHIPNTSMTFDSLMGDVRALGREAALGRDALPKLAVNVVKAANEGVITLDANKHGEGIDDAKFIYGEYVKSDSRKAVHDHTPDGLKAQVSKLRAVIKFGVGTGYDPVDVLDRTMRKRKELAAADPKAVKPAYASYVDVAREQTGKDAPMSDDELAAVIAKAPGADPTLEKVLTSMSKTLEKIITGEHKAGKDQSEQIIKAKELIDERLAAMIRTKDRAEKLAAFEKLSQELGVTH